MQAAKDDSQVRYCCTVLDPATGIRTVYAEPSFQPQREFTTTARCQHTRYMNHQWILIDFACRRSSFKVESGVLPPPSFESPQPTLSLYTPSLQANIFTMSLSRPRTVWATTVGLVLLAISVHAHPIRESSTETAAQPASKVQPRDPVSINKHIRKKPNREERSNTY